MTQDEFKQLMTQSGMPADELAALTDELFGPIISADASSQQYVNKGWTIVTLTSDCDMYDIGHWMQSNIKGDWRAYLYRWVFEHADDATLFAMRWK